MNEAYPIGKYKDPENYSTEDLRLWRSIIREFPSKVKTRIADVDKDSLLWPYRTGGWNSKEVIHHCADSHMNSMIRFKLALTEEEPVIRPYHEDRWARLPDGQDEDLQASIQLLEALHKKWSLLLDSLTEAELERVYIHPENNRRWKLWQAIGLYAWHCEHHLAHIDQALRSEGSYL